MFQGWKRLGAGRSNEDNVSAQDPTDILDIFCENNCSTDQDLYLKFTLRAREQDGNNCFTLFRTRLFK